MIIYKITNITNNKIYIGQTIRDIKYRMYNHFSLNRKASVSAIDLAIKKYGKDNFKIEIICCSDTIENLNYLEQYFINYYNCLSPNGYNLHTGGNNHKCSEETKNKLSQSKKGISNLKLKNKPKSIEHKEKLRLAKLGKRQTKEHIENAAKTRINKRLKSIIAINIQTNEFKIYQGIKFAIKDGFTKSGIHSVLNNKYQNHKGYIFRYMENL